MFVLRAFDDASVPGDADPVGDLDTLELELVLADLASVEGRLDRQRRALKGDKSLAAEIAVLERAAAALGDGVPVYRSGLGAAERELLAPVFLLTDKPVLLVVNIGEDQLDDPDAAIAPILDGRAAARTSSRCACSSRPRRPPSTPTRGASSSKASASARVSCRESRAPATTGSVGARSSRPARPNRVRGRSAPAPGLPSAPA